MSESFTVNSASSLLAFTSHVTKLFNEHKYITYGAPRIGADRSIDQNSLLHLWLTICVMFYLSIGKKEVGKGLLEGMKLDAKKKFLLQNPQHAGWMVHEVRGPLSGSVKKAYTSSASWKRGEAYVFLTWLQMYAANDGLILESKGEFAKLQRKETET